MTTLKAKAAVRKLEAEATRQLLDWTRNTLGFTYAELGGLFGTTPRTAQRWSSRTTVAAPSPKSRTQIEKVRELKRLLGLVFAAPKDTRAWLQREVPVLEGRRPIDLIEQGRMDDVIGVLAGLYSGTFV